MTTYEDGRIILVDGIPTGKLTESKDFVQCHDSATKAKKKKQKEIQHHKQVIDSDEDPFKEEEEET